MRSSGTDTVARRQSQTVHVQAGDTTADVKVKRLRTDAVSGRILDCRRDPISGGERSATYASKGARSETGYATTNDRGEYRVFHIAPVGTGCVRHTRREVDLMEFVCSGLQRPTRRIRRRGLSDCILSGHHGRPSDGRSEG
jgi:hypothetical protein